MIVHDRYDLPHDIRSILVIQLGDIGDVVWATPCLWAVREALPEARLSVVVREGSGQLLKADPAVHRIFEVKKYGSDIEPRNGSS